jgi:mitochondrial fission protein ELM1
MAPVFDSPERFANVVAIPANLVAADEEFYGKGVEEFSKRHSQRASAVAVIVGGPNRVSTMTAQWMKAELEKVFAANAGAEFWVTTSRRTPPEVEAVVDSFPFDYKLIYSRDKFNPIPAFVKLARRLYVTAESTGMLSEACTSGSAEVFALDNLAPGGHKFRRFLDMLAEGGYVGGCRKIDLSAQFAKAKDLLGL